MKIAQVAPLMESVPPLTYGGTERVVSYLTEALIDLGHDVTLFASGDSSTRARLVPVVARSLRRQPNPPDWLMWHTVMLDQVFARASDFDVIHFHVDFLHYPLVRHCPTPCLTTLHGRLDLPDLLPLHRHFREQPLVSISQGQRKPLADCRWVATVPHGLPDNLYHLHEKPSDYFAFVGRIAPEKRLDRAIEIAIATGTRLRIAAKVDRVDAAYFDSRIRPLLNHPLIEHIGEIDQVAKDDFIGQARALLFPIDWPEPFGLVLIEAMACGTPVVAYRCGAVPEIVRDGVTGYIVDDQQQAIAAARRIDRIDRRACRRAFEARFTASRMAQRYVAVYDALSAAMPPHVAHEQVVAKAPI
ncbi:MAG TPA: glycosyltransferase family 4 protein [Burkholderiaceae bacterium]|nr:glycosyltransferase family 4 protein [Burkholderiaceae bacterium]